MTDWDNPKRCNPTHGCGLMLPRSEFRILSHGWHAAMCKDCERVYDRARWHRRMDVPGAREQDRIRRHEAAQEAASCRPAWLQSRQR